MSDKDFRDQLSDIETLALQEHGQITAMIVRETSRWTVEQIVSWLESDEVQALYDQTGMITPKTMAGLIRTRFGGKGV